METIYRIVNLNKDYGEGTGVVHALKNVNFEIHKGEMICIVGGSGSGKSTLLNLIAGMDKADSGSIFYRGKDVVKYNAKETTLYRRNVIGFVFQFFNLLDELTVYQNVTLTPGCKQKRDEILPLLKKLGIEKKIDKYPRQLSGGEQQRASVARALNKESEILLCDEPTGALDYRSGKELLKLIEQLHKKDKNKTIIIVTHTKEISLMCDRIITLRSGQIVSDVINKKKIHAKDIDW